MRYLLLVIIILLVSAETIITKQFNLKAKNVNVFLYSSMCTFFAMLFFVFYSINDLHFSYEFLPYSLAFGIAYGSATICTVFALKNGSMSLTTLIISYSLIIPTLYGIFVLKQPVGKLAYVGLALLIASLYFINKKNENVKFSVIWLISLLLAFFGNGGCSTVQKMEQVAMDGKYASEFMIVALAFAFIVLFVMGIASSNGNKKQSFIDCIKFSPFYGIANGIVNLLVMVLQNKIDTAILFPSISAGGIVLTFILALTLYKEKLSKQQLIGYGIGIASVILLNL